MTRIAIAKGRILKDAIGLFARAGYDTSALAADGPSLFRPLGPQLEAMIVRSSDVPLAVGRGAAALGISGLDTLVETGGELLELLDLGIARCRLCLAGPPGLDFAAQPDRTWRVASKYPNLTARAFAAAGRHCEVVPLGGAVETAPAAGLADVIVDLVDSGRTLKAHDLVIYEEILEVSSRLIAHPTAFFRERVVIADLLARLAPVVAA